MSAGRRLRRAFTRNRGDFAQEVLESLPEPVMACDDSERPVVFNRLARELHGVSARSVPREDWADHYNVFGVDGAPLQRSDDLPLFRALGGEDVHDARLVIRPADGDARSVSVDAAPVRGNDAHIDGAVAVLREVAADGGPRTMLLARALAHVPSAIALVAAGDGRIMYTNPSWNALFGYRDGEVLDCHVSIVTASSDEQFPGERVREIVRAIDTEGAWRGNVRNVRKGGAQFLCSETISRFDDDHFGTVWLTVHTELSR